MIFLKKKKAYGNGSDLIGLDFVFGFHFDLISSHRSFFFAKMKFPSHPLQTYTCCQLLRAKAYMKPTLN